MEISYANRRLEKTVSTPSEIIRSYGAQAKRIIQRIEELKASESLSVVYTLPGARCHELSGTRKGQFAVEVSGNRRIIFKPNHDPVPTKDDGSLDKVRITKISVTEINVDYH